MRRAYKKVRERGVEGRRRMYGVFHVNLGRFECDGSV
jgi:hypothetical protein